MKINNPILLLFVLPTLAPLLLPPQLLIQGVGVVIAVAALILATGYFALRGKALAFTFIIFLQGLNFVVRMMLFFSQSISEAGVVDWMFIVTSILSMALSFYLLFRLDETDIRARIKG